MNYRNYTFLDDEGDVIVFKYYYLGSRTYENPLKFFLADMILGF